MMEPDGLKEAICEAVSQTMEGMAFLEANPATDGFQPEVDEKLYHIHIETNNPPIRALIMVFPQSLANHITSFALGTEEEAPSIEVVRDTLAEVLNTVAGRFMSLLMPHDQAFSLGLPQFREHNHEILMEEALPSSSRFDFEADGMYFSTIVVLSG